MCDKSRDKEGFLTEGTDAEQDQCDGMLGGSGVLEMRLRDTWEGGGVCRTFLDRPEVRRTMENMQTAGVTLGTPLVTPCPYCKMFCTKYALLRYHMKARNTLVINTVQWRCSCHM